MKSNKVFLAISILTVSVCLASCSQSTPPAANAQQAIDQSKAKGDVQAQVNYLADQAKAFVNSKSYDQAVSVANYILANLDSNSQAAKDILEKAKAEMKKAAEGAVDDMKKKIGSFGK